MIKTFTEHSEASEREDLRGKEAKFLEWMYYKHCALSFYFLKLIIFDFEICSRYQY